MVNNNGLRIDPWGSFVYLFLLCSILLEWAHIATRSPNHSFWSVKYSFPVGATSIWSCAPKHFGSAPKNLHLLTQVLPKPKINFEPWVHQWSIADAPRPTETHRRKLSVTTSDYITGSRQDMRTRLKLPSCSMALHVCTVRNASL